VDTVLSAAEAVLARHPAPALRLAHLVERLRADGTDAHLCQKRLRGLLERHPERFRVLDLWRGPWRPLRDRGVPDELEWDCWVAAVTDGEDPPGGDGVAGRMRDTVRWLARRLDARSLHQVTRWCRLALAEEMARSALHRPAA
jgi:hypothetical protein